MRFQGTAYRAHDPRWSFSPLSGAGAAVHGGRFNPQGIEALYLGLTPIIAIREANQGFTAKIDPCVLCSYEVDCDDLVDLATDAGRTEAKVSFDDLACSWMRIAQTGGDPPSWRLVRNLIGAGKAGIRVPSFAIGAGADDSNLVLWSWSDALPHHVLVYDPSGRLPKNQLSWQ